jgi:hypothetical protein
MCVRELQDASLFPTHPSPIRIDRFIEKRFNVVPEYDDLGPGVLGLTKFGKAGVLEVVIARSLEEENTLVGERRIRATLAHEAGHGLLHGHLFGATGESSLFPEGQSNTPKVLCREIGKSVKKSEWWEIQANLAIGGFLLPKPLATRAIDPYMRKSGILGSQYLDESARPAAVALLSEVFNVNQVVARIRLDVLYPIGESDQGNL